MSPVALSLESASNLYQKYVVCSAHLLWIQTATATVGFLHRSCPSPCFVVWPLVSEQPWVHLNGRIIGVCFKFVPKICRPLRPPALNSNRNCNSRIFAPPLALPLRYSIVISVWAALGTSKLAYHWNLLQICTKNTSSAPPTCFEFNPHPQQ